MPIVSLLLGATAGATAGLLFAPSRGRDARAYLQGRTRAGKDAMSRVWDKGRRTFRRQPERMDDGRLSRGWAETDERSATAIIDRAVAERSAAEREHIIDLR
jgi:gas vesicle protein